MSAMLAVGLTGILFLAGLNLLTALWERFSRWRDERAAPLVPAHARRSHRFCIAVDPAAAPLPTLTVDDAVATYHALHHPFWAAAGADTFTPDVLRSLLGSPGDGTVARFDAEGGFSRKNRPPG